MKNILSRKVISLCQLGSTIRLRMALGLHNLAALVPKLEASRRMDGVVNTAMAGTKAAQQGGVVRIDNSVCTQTGNIPLPDGNLRICGDSRDFQSIHHTPFFPLRRQQRILCFKEPLVQRYGWTKVHQTAE